MSTWAGTFPGTAEIFGARMPGGALDPLRNPRAGGARLIEGEWSWFGDLALALLEGVLGGRQTAASHATRQSFPSPATDAPDGCCRCSCFADLGVAGAAVTPPQAPGGGPRSSAHGVPAVGASGPAVPGSAGVAQRPLHTAAPGARPSFEAEVRGRAAHEIDLDLAAIAEDVYDLESRGVAGWTRLDDQQLAAANIPPEMLEDPRTGFRASIYTDGDGRYVLAFAGTDATEIPDWLANLGQGLGFDADQYAQAKDLAGLAHRAFGDDLVITGHSLGGGLAATAALATDSAAVTFNAAGLHGNTIRDLGLAPDAARALAEGGLIRNYVVDGEALTYVQEQSSSIAPFAPDAVGSQIELADPHGFWEHLNPLNLWEPSHRVRLHLMDVVLDAMRQERPWQRAASAA